MGIISDIDKLKPVLAQRVKLLQLSLSAAYSQSLTVLGEHKCQYKRFLT
jgi:hypothetical protein